MTTQPITPAPLSRHPGSRVIARENDIVNAIVTIRDNDAAARNRIRREDVTFTEAAPTSGVPATGGSFADTHVTLVYRAGHVLYADLAMGTGTGSVMEARLSVPDLALTGSAAATPAGGTDVDLRVELPLPDAWPPGEAHRVYVQARRVSGADATTVRVLRAWQR